MCEGIQGKNIKTPKNGSMQARRQTVSTASPEVARESCHGVRPKIMQKKKILPWQANDISTNYNSLGMKFIDSLWIKKKNLNEYPAFII